MCLGLMSGWIWSPFGPHENSLAMLDLVHLHEEAAGYLAANAKDAQILTAWPFSDALTRPEMGYVYEPLHVVRAPGQHLTELASADPHKAQYLAVFTDKMPLEGSMVDWEPIRNLLRKYTDYQPQVSPEEVRAGLGFTPILSWNRHAQHMRIYARTD